MYSAVLIFYKINKGVIKEMGFSPFVFIKEILLYVSYSRV